MSGREPTPAPAVEVRPVRDPAGRLSVLLQANDWWMTMSPDEARQVAGALVTCAGTIAATRQRPPDA